MERQHPYEIRVRETRLNRLHRDAPSQRHLKVCRCSLEGDSKREILWEPQSDRLRVSQRESQKRLKLKSKGTNLTGRKKASRFKQYDFSFVIWFT